MVAWSLVLGGALAIAPAFVILLWSYAPYDRYFRDNILFLYFMAGLFAGMVLALFEALLLLPVGAGLYLPLMVLLGIPLLEQGLKLVALNRRSMQGERAAAFYGGSFGIGFAVMLALYKSQREVPLTAYTDLGVVLADPAPALYLGVVATALLLLHFATGLVLGDAVRTRALKRGLGLAVLALVPLQFLVFEFSRGLLAGAESLVYLPLMLAYGTAVAWWATRTLLPRALPPEAQRARRRLLRKRQRAGAGEGP